MKFIEFVWPLVWKYDLPHIIPYRVKCKIIDILFEKYTKAWTTTHYH